jgi:hypothetical protein
MQASERASKKQFAPENSRNYNCTFLATWLGNLGMPTQEPYPSSLTDAEWHLLLPLIPGPKRLERPPRYARRAILDAIFYAVRSGGAWRL